MPTQRVPLLLFSRLSPVTANVASVFLGLTLSGPSTGEGPHLLRHARGLHETCLRELRPAPGNTLLYASGANAHTIARFNDKRYFAVGGTLYENGTSILTGLNGSRLTLTRIPPGNTQPDQLFVSRGGLLRKISTASVVTQWGIAAPPNGFTVALAAQLTKTIELFEVAADWTVSPGTVTASNEATIKQEGANALKVTVPVNTLAILTKALVRDLSQFAASADSSNEDFVELWVRIDGDSQALDYLTLRFDVGGGDFAANYYEFKILPASLLFNTQDLSGIGLTPAVDASPDIFIGDNGGGEGSDGIVANPGPDSLGAEQVGDSAMGADVGAFTSSAVWSRIRLLKSMFHRSGSSANTWANVAAMQLMIKTNTIAAITCYLDFARMRGGAGMLGDYQSLVTFDNTATGARSNSNPTAVTTLQNDRQRLNYAGLPISTDPQVNARTLWRTLGNGKRFFREKVIANNSATTYTSRVADFVGLWTNASSEILYLPELPTDNTQPDSTHADFIYDQASVFWLSAASSKQGRVYYSPAGRPEAQRGFIQVCQDDLPLSRLVIWNRARYAIGEGGWWRLDGSEPYTSYHFQGIPGVLAAQAWTLVPTPYGIVYQALDGLRIFNGSQSSLLQFERIGPLFRGEASEQLISMLGTAATFARDQYFISDGTQTLSINLASGFIRDLGQGFSALYYEEDTRLLLGANATGLVIVEDVGVAPEVAQNYQTTALYSPPGQISTIQRLYIDADGRSQPITPTLLIDGAEISLPPFTLASRDFIEYALGRSYQSFAVRLTFTPLAGIRIYQIYADIYIASDDQRQR